MKDKANKMFQEYLENKGMRMTSQRSLILEAFLKKEGHFTTEEFHDYIKTLDSSIGQATVYRNLKHLALAGLARELDFGNGIATYEHKYGHDHHDHLICIECGMRSEVFDRKLERIQEKMAEEQGYKLTSHKLYLYGLCPECR